MFSEEENKGMFNQLSGLNPEGGFTTPVGYFDELNARLSQIAVDENPFKFDDADSGFLTPEAYLNNLNSHILRRVELASNKAKTFDPPVLKLYKNRYFRIVSGVAAVLCVVFGLMLANRNEPVLLQSENLSEKEIIDHLQTDDITVDMLCDAGWCNELDKLEPIPKDEDLLNEFTDSADLLDEL